MTGAVNVAWKERRVCVPKETFASNVSPPPKMFLILLVALCEVKSTMIETNKTKNVGHGGEWSGLRTALPSLFPTSVEVLRKNRGRSRVVKITSMSPGFAVESAEGSKRACTAWKMSD